MRLLKKSISIIFGVFDFLPLPLPTADVGVFFSAFFGLKCSCVDRTMGHELLRCYMHCHFSAFSIIFCDSSLCAHFQHSSSLQLHAKGYFNRACNWQAISFLWGILHCVFWAGLLT